MRAPQKRTRAPTSQNEMAVEFKDYYEILGVPRTATDEEIKRAFRKLARKYHPDVATDKKAAEEKFKEINEAYEVLGNPENRRRYDELGAQWRATGGFQPPPGAERRAWRFTSGPGRTAGFQFEFDGTGFSDFFEQFFGRSSPFSGFRGFAEPEEFANQTGFDRSFSQDGANVEGSIMVTLEEVLHGAVREVSLRWTNPTTGQTETRSFRVRIPPGVREEQLIRVPGKGQEGVGGGRPGDLLLRVKLAKHPDFEVRGSDLYYQLPLTPWEAALGTTVTVPTLDGSVSIRVPPGTSSGQHLRVRGRGLPTDPKGHRGDFYVTISIQVPPQTSPQERALWEQLARTSSFDPRSR